MPPLISIIIPAYNAAPWIAETIKSALAQTWPQIEILVVDDGSTDATASIVRQFTVDRLRVISQPNAGASAARNTGLRAAAGDYIQFLDADDLLAPEKIARQISLLADAPPGAIASGPWGSFCNNSSDARFHREPVWGNLSPLDWLVSSWCGGGMFPPLVWLTPREVIKAAGPWNEALSLDDDGEYFCRVLFHSSGIHFAPDAHSYYRTHDGLRISTSRGDRAASSSFRSMELKEHHALAREDSPRMRRALALNWQRFVWEQLADAPSLAAQAHVRMQALDPGLPPPDGPRMYRLASQVLGWRRARRLQLSARKILPR